MRTTLLTLAFFAIAFFAMPSYTTAQEEMKPKRVENAEWKNVVHVRFETGKRGRALEIIRKHFMKAGATAGTPGPEMMVELATGEWDLLLVWNMKDGVDALNWEVTADNIAWRTALNKQEGGADKAGALLEEYQGLVAMGKSEIGMVKK